MFGRRVPPKYVLLFSVLFALACAALAVYLVTTQSWIGAAVSGVLAIWFAIDSVRAWSWQRK